VQAKVRDRPQRGDHHGAERDRRGEVGIHDVDMDGVGMRLDQLDLVGEVRQVGEEDRDGELAHRRVCYRRPGSFFRNAARNIASQPCRCGHRRMRSAGPSGSRAARARGRGIGAGGRRARRRSRRAGTCRPSRRAGPRASRARPRRSRSQPASATGPRRRTSSRATAARGGGGRSRSRSTAHPRAPCRTHPRGRGAGRPARGAARARRGARRWRRRGGSGSRRRRRPRRGHPAARGTRRGRPCAGARADIEHPLPRSGVERRHDERGRLVLDGEPAVGEPGSCAGAPERTRSEPGWTVPRSISTPASVRRASRSSRLARQVFTRRAIGPRSVRAAAAGTSSGSGSTRRSSRTAHVARPVRKEIASSVDPVSAPAAGPRRGAAGPRSRSRAGARGEGHGLGDGGVGRDPREQDLVRTESQRREGLVRRRRERAVHEPAERVVERDERRSVP